MNRLNKYLKHLGGFVILLLLFSSGWFVRDLGARSDMEKVLKNHEIKLQEIKVVKTENTTLIKALASAAEEHDVLLDEIASLKSKPAEIRYITKVETVVVGSETHITTELPDSHLFVLENGLPVAEFTVQLEGNNSSPEYYFNTADLILRADVIIGERDSAISLRMESDLDPNNEREIPVKEFNVKHIRERKLFEPNILIGAGAHLHINKGIPTGTAGPYVAISWIHPNKKLLGAEYDLLSVRAGSNDGKILEIGFDPILYNVGDKLPILTNVWLGAGITTDTNGQLSGTISIGAKL